MFPMTERRIILNSILVSEKIKKLWDKTCRGKYGLSFNQFMVLLIIIDKKITWYNDIKNIMFLSKSSLSQTIKLMLHKWLIINEKFVWDNRKINFEATTKWRQIFQKVLKLLEFLLKNRFNEVTQTEKFKLNDCLEKMLKLYIIEWI